MKESHESQPAKFSGDLEALSKAELIELARLYARLFVAVDGFWYLAVKDFVSQDMATKCDIWVWDKYPRYEFRRLKSLLDIQGDDLKDFARVFRWSPSSSMMTYDFSSDGDNKWTLVVKECATLRALEREGAGRHKTFCREVDTPIFQQYVRAFNPKAKAIPVQLPPDMGDGSICCRWQFVLEE